MEYFRFWRIYLSGVVVSDLPQWERGLSTSRLPIAIRRVSFRIRVVLLTTRRRTCLALFGLPAKGLNTCLRSVRFLRGRLLANRASRE
jgi:hypothetical protein